jgi:hypothetical protein
MRESKSRKPGSTLADDDAADSSVVLGAFALLGAAVVVETAPDALDSVALIDAGDNDDVGIAAFAIARLTALRFHTVLRNARATNDR